MNISLGLKPLREVTMNLCALCATNFAVFAFKKKSLPAIVVVGPLYCLNAESSTAAKTYALVVNPAFEPSLIAHGSQVTTDMALSVTAFAAARR